MVSLMTDNSAADAELIQRVQCGDRGALAEMFSRHRERLRRMVEIRLDRRLLARVDASDVMQEAFLEASRQLPEYVRDPRLPVFLWLRLVVGDRLMKLHRAHLGA
jgi:RNA polymerase sigma-70 factor, ECF subfamily